jgi:hypothetical protein
MLEINLRSYVNTLRYLRVAIYIKTIISDVIVDVTFVRDGSRKHEATDYREMTLKNPFGGAESPINGFGKVGIQSS